MENDLLLTLFGFLVGVFGTLIGAGGGFILTPVLLLLYPHDTPDTITGISLSVTFANALSGSFAYARLKRIQYKYGLIFAAAAVPGAVIGALSTYYVPRRTFDLIFGIVLTAASAIIYVTTPRENDQEANGKPDLSGRQMLAGIGISMFVGVASGFLGIGGGIIHVPALTGILRFPVHLATATSHFILAIMTLAGVLVHVAAGSFHHGVTRTVFLAAGVLVGAQGGAFLSSRVKGKVIIRILAAALAFVALRLFVQSAT